VLAKVIIYVPLVDREVGWAERARTHVILEALLHFKPRDSRDPFSRDNELLEQVKVVRGKSLE
jgi:hypothetical protein